MGWNSLIGQARVKDILRASLKRNRLAHAYLFTGAEGLGMDAAAIELAKIVNCETKSFEACDECKSCLAVREFRHPNINFIFALPSGKGEKSGDDPLSKLSEDDIAQIQEELRLKASNPYHKIQLPKAASIKINSIRQIRMESSLSMFSEGKRVFILFDADTLNDEAGNALLKILEEPHESTMLILTTSKHEQVLPTIHSRCQKLLFEPLTEEEITEGLVEKEHLPRPDAALVAHLSGGSYGRALELNGPAIVSSRNDAVGFLRTALYKSRAELLDEIERLQDAYERNELSALLTVLEAWLRDTQLIREGAADLQSGLDKETAEKFTRHHGNVNYESVFDAMANAISLLDKNVYIPLVLIQLALELRKHILLPSL